jgi:aminopeptidase N
MYFFNKQCAALLGLFWGLLGSACAEAFHYHHLYCGHLNAPAATSSAAMPRQYAPDRQVDILHLALDVTPDFQSRTVNGTATLTFSPIATPLAELRLNGVDLLVAGVNSTEPIRGWHVTPEEVVIAFETPVEPGKEARVSITYTAIPAKGLYFRTPEMGYSPGDMHLFTQGEPFEARHWYPSHDYPNEKFTSEITCRVPEGMTVLSNGRLISSAADPATGLRAVRWVQDKPHVNYLVALAAGYFEKIEDAYGEIPMAFWTVPSDIAQAANSFQDTKDMMAFFEKEIGFPYPWSKYDQVCVQDFPWGGMENTSLTILNDRTLFTSATENIRSSQGLVAHELAHQWFGNLVTCKDWSHIWLNEGFATYYDMLYDGHKNGRESMLHSLWRTGKGLVERGGEPRPIVSRHYSDPEQKFRNFGHLAYGKGAWILHMLRSELGPELFQHCVQTYLERHQFGTVVTEDLRAVIEELSGRSFDRFFDQWLYHAHHPELNVSYIWDQRARQAKVSVRQVQPANDSVLLFQFPLRVRFYTPSGPIDRQVRIEEREQDFYFALPEAPQIARIDPELELLAKINFQPALAMLYAQLANPEDAMGRLLAVEQLASRKDIQTVNRLGTVLNQDPFHAVRIGAARALQAIHTPEALQVLTASLDQTDARVRLQVVSAIAGFYHPDARDAAIAVIEKEQNPEILAAAARGLARHNSPGTESILLRLLASHTYRNGLADAAIDAIRAQEETTYVRPLMETLRARQANFTTAGFARGLDTLAYISRHQQGSNEVREFIAGYVNHPRQGIQLAAIHALGTLRDTKAIPILEGFAATSRNSPERAAAERALTALRANNAPSENLAELRRELLQLQRSQTENHRQIEDLRKQLDAVAGHSQQAPAPAAPARSTRPILPPRERR